MNINETPSKPFNSLEILISRHADFFPDFEYYLMLTEKAERNKEAYPDVAIECCNSLIQGISKSIIIDLESESDLREINKCDTDRLVKRSLNCLRENDDVYEDDFIRRGVSLALSISTLRNARGDISHGKAVPKELCSDKSLAHIVMEITSTLLRYTLASFYTIKIESSSVKKEEPILVEDIDDEVLVKYEANQNFNDYLDENNPIQGKLIHSHALYQLYYEDYILQLSEFTEYLESLE